MLVQVIAAHPSNRDFDNFIFRVTESSEDLYLNGTDGTKAANDKIICIDDATEVKRTFERTEIKSIVGGQKTTQQIKSSEAIEVQVRNPTQENYQFINLIFELMLQDNQRWYGSVNPDDTFCMTSPSACFRRRELQEVNRQYQITDISRPKELPAQEDTQEEAAPSGATTGPTNALQEAADDWFGEDEPTTQKEPGYLEARPHLIPEFQLWAKRKADKEESVVSSIREVISNSYRVLRYSDNPVELGNYIMGPLEEMQTTYSLCVDREMELMELFCTNDVLKVLDKIPAGWAYEREFQDWYDKQMAESAKLREQSNARTTTQSV